VRMMFCWRSQGGLVQVKRMVQVVLTACPLPPSQLLHFADCSSEEHEHVLLGVLGRSAQDSGVLDRQPPGTSNSSVFPTVLWDCSGVARVCSSAADGSEAEASSAEALNGTRLAARTTAAETTANFHVTFFILLPPIMAR
jgi:hypothetical protein